MIKILCFFVLFSVCFATKAGGKTELSKKDIQELLSENGNFTKGLDMATEKLNEGANKIRLVREKVVSATSQVVAGQRYDVKVKMVDSVCENLSKNANKNINDCPENKKSNKKAKICDVIIWIRTWLKSPENLIVTVKC